jgi:hypothetical protein
MPLPIALTVAYLAINLAVMVWLERERASGRDVSWQVAGVAGLLRYGPPIAGAIYLLTISGDWLFAIFVLGFFGTAAWLMSGLLAYTQTGSGGPGETRRNRR